MKNAAEKPLPLNRGGCITAIVPDSVAVKLGTLVLFIEVFPTHLFVHSDTGNCYRRQCVEELDLKSFTVDKYRFCLVRPIVLAGKTAMIFNIFPVH